MLGTLNSGPRKDATQKCNSAIFTIMNDAEGRPPSMGKGWVARSVRPIGIGIAALLTVSLAHGVPTPTPTPTVAGTDTAQDRINADRLLAERAAQEQKAADDAKLAAKRAADDAKLLAERLAEQQKVDRRDETKLVPRPEASANAKIPEKSKTLITQKEPHSSRDSGRRSSTVSQSANRPAPVAPVTRPPPAPRPTNKSQRPETEFGPTAPGG
jgi:hypothetical protein